jgi:hypothetical protein
MLSDWWNGVELWIAGLPFPFQFALVIVVLVPLCLVVAWLIDRIVDHASAFFGPAKHEEPPLGVKLEESGEAAEPPADAVPAESVPAEPVPDSDPAEPAAADAPRVPAESTGR